MWGASFYLSKKGMAARLLGDDAAAGGRLLDDLLGDDWIEDACYHLLRAARVRKARAIGRNKRKGGWKPLPRQQAIYGTPEGGRPIDKWQHDSSRASVLLYLDAPCDGSYHERNFRKEFRVPRVVFDHYYAILQQVPGLGDSVRGNGRRGRRSQPLKNKLAAWFLWLGEGLSFKRAARSACIDPGMFRKFCHQVNAWLVEHEYPNHVYMPTTEADVAQVTSKFAKMGFPGCITTCDGVKIEWGHCPTRDTWLCEGKEGYPTRSYNCCVGPNREFHHVHGSHPGATNDKTMSRFDAVLNDLRNGTTYGAHTFTLRTSQSTTTQARGLYCICDNGYHAWRCLMYPMKSSSLQAERRW